MSDQEQQSGHHHGSFISGILVGVLLALLFTTGKGKKLLKIIGDEGLGKFHKWEDLLSLLEEQILGEIKSEEEPIMGEDLKEEIKEIEASKKAPVEEVVQPVEKLEKKEEKKVEEKFEEEDQEVEKALDDIKVEKKEAHAEAATIVEKIEEKVKEVEALASELREVKEAIEEKVEGKEDVKIKEEPKFEEDLPLHKALDTVVEDPSAGSGQDTPKKKVRRLFKGIRRK
ncbi:hypothetical protein BH09PAT1_BH09PAT1_0620 [soil metagenome]